WIRRHTKIPFRRRICLRLSSLRCSITSMSSCPILVIRLSTTQYSRASESISGNMDADLYSFVYKGILTEEALDRVGRRRKVHLGAEEASALMKSLSFD